ncbi:hypothetical protein D3C85_1060570 [compost metagenome]
MLRCLYDFPVAGGESNRSAGARLRQVEHIAPIRTGEAEGYVVQLALEPSESC